MNDQIKQQLKENGYDYAVAIATKAEIEVGAACGQLSILTEE
jgi:adenine C2-methylase RlmN of 23S rRNA A2503 and tRNA A37